MKGEGKVKSSSHTHHATAPLGNNPKPDMRKSEFSFKGQSGEIKGCLKTDTKSAVKKKKQ